MAARVQHFHWYCRDEIEWVLSEEQRTRIIAAVTKNPYQIGEVGLNFNGQRTLHKFLENLSTPEQISLVVNALYPSTVDLANDPNGQHIIKYCVEQSPYEYHKVFPHDTAPYPDDLIDGLVASFSRGFMQTYAPICTLKNMKKKRRNKTSETTP